MFCLVVWCRVWGRLKLSEQFVIFLVRILVQTPSLSIININDLNWSETHNSNCQTYHIQVVPGKTLVCLGRLITIVAIGTSRDSFEILRLPAFVWDQEVQDYVEASQSKLHLKLPTLSPKLSWGNKTCAQLCQAVGIILVKWWIVRAW